MPGCPPQGSWRWRSIATHLPGPPGLWSMPIHAVNGVAGDGCGVTGITLTGAVAGYK